MFLLIGLGERGGSGVPKIYSGWRSQQWRPPSLYDKDEPEQTLLELHMIDLLPAGVTDHLRKRFGAKFNALEHTARLILRSEEHTTELQSLMRISYAVFCLKKT